MAQPSAGGVTGSTTPRAGSRRHGNTQVGRGTTYLVGGLGEPYAASVPLLVLTSDIHRASRGSGALTEIDQGRLFSAVTKWSATASSAHEIPALISTALAAATTGRPGPASVIIPEDVLDERSAATPWRSHRGSGLVAHRGCRSEQYTGSKGRH